MKRKTAFKIGLAIFLLAFAICLVFYNKLPERMPIHFGPDNQADSYASKNMALFGTNLLILGIYLLSYFVTNKDPKKDNQGDQALNVVLISVPIISIFASGMSISYALGNRPRIDFYLLAFMSIMFILIGNYLPKTKRNYTIGIKIPWTLANDYVWEKTHRLGGYLWIGGGVLSLISLFIFKNYINYIFAGLVFAMVLIPVCYAYLLYERIKKDGKNDKNY